MKIIKRLIITLLVLIVLFIGAGFAASQFIDKDLIEKQVSEKTGRDFKINGELTPSISLTPSVSAEKVVMSNAVWGSKSPLASVGKFDIKVQLLPLLQKKIVVDKIDIDAADISLEQKDGHWNFEFDNATKAGTDKDKPASEKKKMSFDISGLSITNSKLTINQGSGPVVVNVKSLKLTPHDKVMTLDFDGAVNNKSLKVTVDLPPVDVLMAAKKIDVANLLISSEDIKVKANMLVDNEAKKVTINSFDFNKGDIAMSGKGWADINSKKVELVNFTGSKGDIGITGKVVADLNAKRVDITNLAAKKGNLKINGAISADISGKKPFIRGSINADTIDLSAAGGKDDKSSGAKSGSGGKGSADDALPLDGLDAANVDIKLNIGKLISGDIVLDKLTAAVKLNNGVLVINPLNTGFGGGQVTSNITLSRSGARVNMKASGILMEKVLAQTVGYNDFKNGLANIDIALAGNGNTINSIVNSLSGTSKVTMKQATYSGQIFKGRAEQLMTVLRGGNANQPIEINCAVTDINWSNGTGSLQDMGFDTKYANLTGKGTITLPGHRLGLTLNPVSKIAKINNLAVAVKVGGTFESPQVSYADIVKDIGTNAVKNIGTSYLESLSSGKKFKVNAKTALGIDKKAVINSPCGAAPVANPNVESVPPVDPNAAATNPTGITNPLAPTQQIPAAEGQPAPAANAEPEQPLSKQQKKDLKRQQKIEKAGTLLKGFGL